MNFREFIKILNISIKNSLKKIKNDNDFHKILSITYFIEKAIKKSKKY